MIKAILLDLDDTLLGNADHRFVPAYLEAADTFFLETYRLPHMSDMLVGSLRAMQRSRNPLMSNTTIALQAIAEAGEVSSDLLIRAFQTFYQEDYPKLEVHTYPIEAAPKLLDHLLSREIAVVIATNPVYPTAAIQQRLKWAGLSDDLTTYAFVSTGDNMHFVKPDPTYYAEIIARVGVEPDEAIMVGNSQENDILAADEAGLHTFHIDPASADQTLASFLAQVQANPDWEHLFPGRAPQPKIILPELRGNIGALFGMLDEVQPQHWNQHPDPNEWSILQIVCHLLEREEAVQLPRLRQIYEQDNPFLSAPPEPAGASSEICHEDGLDVALRFADAREETLQFLGEIAPEAWYRPARHSIFSQTNLLEMAHFTAQHDRMHLNQLCQTFGRCE